MGYRYVYIYIYIHKWLVDIPTYQLVTSHQPAMKWTIAITWDMRGLSKEILSPYWDDHNLRDPPTVELVSVEHWKKNKPRWL